MCALTITIRKYDFSEHQNGTHQHRTGYLLVDFPIRFS